MADTLHVGNRTGIVLFPGTEKSVLFDQGRDVPNRIADR
tara:strand:- start:361 stop:477 length:117 start_codon:yes stop_codon:yes gene_type:complete